jgi:hypothetical protein
LGWASEYLSAQAPCTCVRPAHRHPSAAPCQVSLLPRERPGGTDPARLVVDKAFFGVNGLTKKKSQNCRMMMEEIRVYEIVTIVISIFHFLSLYFLLLLVFSTFLSFFFHPSFLFSFAQERLNFANTER